MSRKKRLKNRGLVGPKMRAAAAREPGRARDGVATGFQSSEKAALFEELAQSLAGKITSTSLPEASARSEAEPADGRTVHLETLFLCTPAAGADRRVPQALRCEYISDGEGAMIRHPLSLRGAQRRSNLHRAGMASSPRSSR